LKAENDAKHRSDLNRSLQESRLEIINLQSKSNKLQSELTQTTSEFDRAKLGIDHIADSIFMFRESINKDPNIRSIYQRKTNPKILELVFLLNHLF
jgi:hypothetical protein